VFKALRVNKGLLVVFFLAVFWGLAVASRILWTGDVYGLDFRVYHPDGACYSQFAFNMAGRGEARAVEIIKTNEEFGNPISFVVSESGDQTLDCYGRGRFQMSTLPFAVLLAGLAITSSKSMEKGQQISPQETRPREVG